MQNSTNMRILELLRFLYERTDENHPATVSDIIAHLNGKGIQAVRQTVYADTNALIDARSEERRVGKECRSRWSPYH